MKQGFTLKLFQATTDNRNTICFFSLWFSHILLRFRSPIHTIHKVDVGYLLAPICISSNWTRPRQDQRMRTHTNIHASDGVAL